MQDGPLSDFVENEDHQGRRLMKCRSSRLGFTLWLMFSLVSGCGRVSQSGSGTSAPTVPTNLAAGTVTSSSVSLSWTASSSSAGVAGYNVFRNGTKVGTSTTTSYTDTGLSASTSYSYAVEAYDSSGDTSAMSASVTITTLAAQPPTVPTNLTATAITYTSVTLSWTASTSSAGVAGYNIIRNGTKVGTSTSTSYMDTGLSPSTSYSYTVSAYDASGNTSDASAAFTVTTLAISAPTVPSGLSAGSITASSIVLSWTASSSPVGVVGYKVFRNGTTVGTPTTTSYMDSGLSASTSYSYTVSAYDAYGDTSALSSALSVTTSAQSATAPTAPANFTASTTDFTASATYCNVTMSWEASTGSAGIDHYAILRNGTTLATTSNLSYQDGSAAANTTYSYEVVAYDPSGNASNPSTSVSVSTGSCTVGQNFRLGVVYTSTQSTFSVWSPTYTSVQLNLNGVLYPMTLMTNPPNGYTDVYSVTVPGDLNGQTYNFVINGTTSRDPYGVMTQPGMNNDIVMDPSQTKLPAGWTPRPTLTDRVDSIVYEADVREFSNDSSSGIPSADRGYFEGMTDTGATVNGAAGAPSTGIDHLVDMGVTHIQIMPFFDYNDCVSSTAENTCFNWGYDPFNYNVPTSNYSETPTNYTNRILEVKQMIDNFHRQGIRVIMDVVYNHTTNEDVFGDITPDYYLSNDITGTGNTLDGSNPMVARMIQDSLEYWVTQYNVDGFRFDLLGVFPLATVNQWGTYLTSMYPDRNLLLYGEPWVDGAPASTAFNLGDLGTIASSHFGAFNAAYRGAVKGTDDDGGGNTGFLFNQSTSDSFFGAYVSSQNWPNGNSGYGPISLGFAASPVAFLPATTSSNAWDPAFSASPEQAVNYVSVHDNLCLYDKITLWQSANNQTGQSITNNLIAYAFGMVLTPEGIPFFYEGDEFQRTKDDNSNSYTTEYDLVWSNLENSTSDAATYAYVKGLIALRNAHPSLRFSTWDDINRNVQSNQESASLVMSTIKASAAANETWKTAVVVYNSSPTAQQITLPSGSGTWCVAVYGQTIEPTGTTASSMAGSNATPSAAWGLTIFYQ
jgi:pullulanase